MNTVLSTAYSIAFHIRQSISLTLISNKISQHNLNSQHTIQTRHCSQFLHTRQTIPAMFSSNYRNLPKISLPSNIRPPPFFKRSCCKGCFSFESTLTHLCPTSCCYVKQEAPKKHQPRQTCTIAVIT